MSALAGIWNFDDRPDAGESCARMLAAQAIYGAHGQAQWDMGTMAMGRRLHRALPEDIHDNQPLSGGDGRFVLVADLRLDNRDELIGALGLATGEARQLADSAVLLKAWERWQENCFDRLVGDYAFALWDAKAQRLFLARDAIGQRPLHYHRGKTFFAFSTMPKGLHTLRGIPREPDEQRIAEFLALLPETGPQTFFKNVERVESGCVVTVTRDGATARRHWEPSRKTLKLANAGEYAEGMRHHLDQAVRAQLRGAGNTVAAHLSAGFDSSAVATAAALEMRKRNGKVVAFTAVPREGYDGPSPPTRTGDEGPIAARTAALHPNIEHVLIRAGGRSPLAALDRSFFIYERPVLNVCNLVWGEAINDAARERKLTVLFTGQMGNMGISFDGLTLLSQLVRSGRLIRWTREAAALLRSRHVRPWGLLNASFGAYMPLPLWTLIQKIARNRDVGLETYSAINPKRAAEIDLARLARERALDLSYRPRKDGFESRLWGMRRIDLGNYNKGALGGWGIDMRDPTSERRLLEFCLSVPEDQFLVGGDTKALTRRAFAGRMAPEAIALRGKGYQALDWHEGLTAARPALAEEIERLDAFGPTAAAIDVARLKALVEDWPKEGWETQNVMRPYRLALLRAVSTGHFFRRAGGSNA